MKLNLKEKLNSVKKINFKNFFKSKEKCDFSFKKFFSSSIGLKLALIMALAVFLSFVSVISLFNYFIRQSEGINAEQNNQTLNIRAAAAIENELTGICSNSFQLLDMMAVISQENQLDLLNKTQDLFFQRNSNIACILLSNEKSISLKILNNTYFKENNLDKKICDEYIQTNQEDVKQALQGQSLALNSSVEFGKPSIALMLPWGEKTGQICIIVFATDSISENISLGVKSINNTYVVNKKGDYLIHSDTEKIKSRENAKDYPLVKKMLESEDLNSQIEFKDANKIKYFGAFKKIDLFGVGVLTQAESSLVYEAINQTTKNNIFLALVILGLTIIAVLLYTHLGLSKPLKILKGGVSEINKGNFNNEYLEYLKTKRIDEIGVLNSAVLDERDFLNTFARFTNQNVATAIATKSIDFEPHLKDVSIFFSDIRGFTSISDGFKNKYGTDSAKQIIGFLNDYMKRMVQCVELTHGNIDKYEGDAIMAVWGLLRNDDLSFEELPDGAERKEKELEHLKNCQEDAVNCITGSIAMRYALMEYNKNAASLSASEDSYKPIIKIGCGINSGRANVGLMGSEYKMEYTSIGDAVNLASRTEAANKPAGTDILITEDTYNLIKADYIRCQENNFTIPAKNKAKEIVVEQIPVSFSVKGKGEQHFYGVVNMPAFDIGAFFKIHDKNFKVDKDCALACGKNGPKSLAEVRSLLGIPVPDFSKINLNEAEDKIEAKN